MADYLTVCRGVVDLNNNPPTCSGQWIASQTDVVFDLAANIDAVTANEYFMAGFVFVASVCLLSIALSSLLSLIKGE